MTVAWRWLAFTGPGSARPVYHATIPMSGLTHNPRWDRACEGKGNTTEIDADGREKCITCLRRVLGVAA